MAVAQGYGKTVTSGSVFAYDVADTRNSYRGRPTVNYIAHHNAMPQTSYDTYTYTTSGTWPAKHPLAIRAYNAQGSELSAYVNTGVGDWTNTYHAHWQYDPILKKPVTVMQASDGNWKAKSFGTGMAAWSSLGMSAGQQYVISWDQYTTDINLCADAGFYSRNGSGTLNFHDGRSYGSTKNTLLNTWQRVYYTFTINATRNLSDSYGSIYMYGHTTSNSGGTLKIANVQLELGVSVPSPYVDHTSAGLSSTRSSTQGLLPLVGNSTLDLTNVSFNSNAQMTFDGTNDYFDIPYSSTLDTPNGCTYELMVYPTGAGEIINRGTNDGNDNPRIYLYSNGTVYFDWSSGGTDRNITSIQGLTVNAWNHLVCTATPGSSLKIYKNSIEIASGTTQPNPLPNTSDNIQVGRVSWIPRYGSAKIDVLKIYNRTLSAGEIRQNYLHYKTRFNLS